MIHPDWDRIAADHRRRVHLERRALCPTAEMQFWRRRARWYRLLFWLAVLIILVFARK
jgi:hypothetical protein